MLKVPKVQSDSRTGPKRQHFLARVLLVFIVKVKEFAKVFRDLVCRKIAQDEQAREGGRCHKR